MTDIKAGDWVTVADQGPYEVDAVRQDWPDLRIRLVVDDEIRPVWVKSSWCRKAWKPAPGTIWQDSDGHLYQTSESGRSMARLGVVATFTTVHVFERGPVVELVPKETPPDTRKSAGCSDALCGCWKEQGPL